MEYDLELDKAIDRIKKEKANLVLLQLPDGLKPRAREIQEELGQSTSARILIWGGSNFGACDAPVEVERLGVDLVLAWGHSAWRY